MSDPLPAGEPPSENTLTINITHEMLEMIQDVYPHSVVVSPTRHDEGEQYGYDVSYDWRWGKTIGLQLKPPQNGLGGIQIPGRGVSDSKVVKFGLYGEQLDDLHRWYDEQQAFYALPPVLERRNLIDRLADTVFIDVTAIPEDTTLVYIPPKEAKRQNSSAIVRVNNQPRWVPKSDIYYWSELWPALLFEDIGIQIAPTLATDGGNQELRSNQKKRESTGESVWEIPTAEIPTSQWPPQLGEDRGDPPNGNGSEQREGDPPRLSCYLQIGGEQFPEELENLPG